MNEITEGWLQIAAENEECALDLNESVTKRKDRIIGFLAQQAIEAYLKASLTLLEPMKSPDRTHDILMLLQQISKYKFVPNEMGEEGALLTPYATTKRYDFGEKVTDSESRRAVHAMKLLSSWIKKELLSTFYVSCE